MSFVASDILEIRWNHPTLGEGVMFPKSNEDSSFDKGGFRAEDDESMIAGNGQAIQKLRRARWSAESVIAWNSSENPSVLDQMVDLAGDPTETDFTISLKSGPVFRANGRPVGDLKGNANAGTFPLKLAGGQLMELL